jgi:hypothetical protein
LVIPDFLGPVSELVINVNDEEKMQRDFNSLNNRPRSSPVEVIEDSRKRMGKGKKGKKGKCSIM